MTTGSPPGTDISLTTRLTGLGGMIERTTIVPVLTGAPEGPDNPAGAQGKYEASLVLVRPPNSLPTDTISVIRDIEGDSYVRWLAPPSSGGHFRITSTIDGRTIAFDMRTNKRGFLARADTGPFDAANFDDAENAAYRGIASGLSHWSTLLDVPLAVGRVYVHELITGARRVSHELLFPEPMFAPGPGGALSVEYRLYASLYREGLSSNRPAYQYLCFFKIAEGIRSRRARIDAEKVARGEKPAREAERIPPGYADVPVWLDGLFAGPRRWDDYSVRVIVPEEALGRKVGALFETTLMKLRNEIAHALTDEGEPVPVGDDEFDPLRLHKWLPLLRVIVRLLIKNEFPEFLGRHPT